MEKVTGKGIMTSETVTTTYLGQQARRRRIIEYIGKSKNNNNELYKVRTDLVGYEPFEEAVLDEEGQPTVDANGDAITVTKQRLMFYETLRRWEGVEYTHEALLELEEAVIPLLPEGLNRFEKEEMEMLYGLLIETKSKQRWGDAPALWVIQTETDLEIV